MHQFLLIDLGVRDEMNYLLFTRGYTIHKVPHRANEMDSNGARVLYVPGKCITFIIVLSAYWKIYTGIRLTIVSILR